MIQACKFLILVVLALLPLDVSFAQNSTKNPPDNTTIELPRFVEVKISTVVHVPDAGKFMSGRSFRKSALANRVRKTMNGSTAVYQFTQKKEPVIVEVHEEGQIDITIVKTFSSENIAELQLIDPQAAKELESLLNNRDDSSKPVEFLTPVTYSAMHEGQLEKLYPDLFELYVRFCK